MAGKRYKGKKSKKKGKKRKSYDSHVRARRRVQAHSRKMGRTQCPCPADSAMMKVHPSTGKVFKGGPRCVHVSKRGKTKVMAIKSICARLGFALAGRRKRRGRR